MGLPQWATQADNVSGGRVMKSASITLASGVVRFVASMATAIILGRLLSPDDFGLVGMVMPLIALVSIFADGGVSYYTLRSRNLNHADTSLTFWLGGIVAFGFFLFFFSASPLVARFYDEPRLTPVAAVLAATFLLTIFSAQHNALVKRCYRQDLFAVAEISGSIVGLVVGVLLAWRGAAYWALVAAPLARQAVHSAVIWSLTRWVPALPRFDWEKSKAILSFGWFMIFSIALGALMKNIDKVLLGWQFDTQEVGYYTMAYSIMMLPVWQVLTPIGGAVVPYLSQIRSDPARLRQGLQVLVVVLGVIIAPAMCWAALISEPLLRFVLGEQWVPSARIFSMLALASISMALTMPLGWSFVACDQPKRFAAWTTLTFFPVVGGYIIGLNWGGFGVAAAYFLVTTLLLLVFPRFASRCIPVESGAYLIAVGRVVLLSALVSIPIFLMQRMLNVSDWLLIVLTGLVLLLSVPLLFVLIFGRAYLKNLMVIFRKQ